MTMDRVLGLVALAVFTGFIGIIVFSVLKPALIAVALIGCGLAAYDIWGQLFKGKKSQG
ncbi:hypothetical protein [Oceanibaculum indicum]|uniref:Uncharacterized protein n=1 Tax=Oceanibaculum indicum TaxID=526216 RepID=A0A420WQJ6_9PROT|nr:hypothetical protein [Oceanibaculum indicum]RKQ73269.1 hypothetical protein BCL74_1055 [Oceanibaculum indicum]